MFVIKAVLIPVFFVIGFFALIIDWLTTKQPEKKPIEVIEETSCPIARRLDALERCIPQRMVDRQ